MPQFSIERLSIRSALAIGFGLTLAVWLLAGYYFVRQTSIVESEAASISARYLRAQDALSGVGNRVLLASVYLRDSLLDPDPNETPSRRARFDELYDGLERQLDAYVPVMDSSDEREQVQRLRLEITALREASREILGTVPRSAREGRDLLNTHVVPRRESVIAATEGVRALNRAAYVDQQREITELHRNADRRSWQWLGAGFAICLAIGVLATVYSARLEERLRRQGATEARNRERLQRLSDRLITSQEEERRSLARELHDEVGQVLTAVKVELAVAQRRMAASGGAPEQLGEALAITDSAVQSVRDLSYLLHPAMLDDLGLIAALDWYLHAFEKRHSVTVEFTHEDLDARLSPEMELAAYRIVQEAMTNVARHSHARRCRVTLTAATDAVHLTVADDGRGFDGSSGESGRRGLGLLSMRERAERVKGTLTIETAPGVGTRIDVVLPSKLLRRTAEWTEVERVSD